MDRIYYQCKNCGWKASILAQWADLRPKRCTTKGCQTSFIKNPDALLISHSENPVEEKLEQSQNLDIAKDSSDALEKSDRKRKSVSRP